MGKFLHTVETTLGALVRRPRRHRSSAARPAGLAAALTVSSLFGCGVAGAASIYDLNSSSNGALGSGPFGTVTVTRVGPNLVIRVNLRSDLNFNAGGSGIPFTINIVTAAPTDFVDIGNGGSTGGTGGTGGSGTGTSGTGTGGTGTGTSGTGSSGTGGSGGTGGTGTGSSGPGTSGTGTSGTGTSGTGTSGAGSSGAGGTGTGTSGTGTGGGQTWTVVESGGGTGTSGTGTSGTGTSGTGTSGTGTSGTGGGSQFNIICVTGCGTENNPGGYPDPLTFTVVNNNGSNVSNPAANVVDPAGNTAIVTPLCLATGCDPRQVPEPGSLAIALLSLGGLGLILRSRHARRPATISR